MTGELSLRPLVALILCSLSGDRPTVFIEIIERVGCLRVAPPTTSSTVHRIPGTQYACSARVPGESAAAPAGSTEGSAEVPAVQGIEVDYERFKEGAAEVDGVTIIEQSAGCGGFGKGNFSELFKR